MRALLPSWQLIQHSQNQALGFELPSIDHGGIVGQGDAMFPRQCTDRPTLGPPRPMCATSSAYRIPADRLFPRRATTRACATTARSQNEDFRVFLARA